MRSLAHLLRSTSGSRVLHNAAARLSAKRQRALSAQTGAPCTPSPFHDGGAPGPDRGAQATGGKGDGMQETEQKRGRAVEESTGKPTAREEPRKIRDEEDPGTADALAVPDYVMRDFEENPGEGTEGGEPTL